MKRGRLRRPNLTRAGCLPDGGRSGRRRLASAAGRPGWRGDSARARRHCLRRLAPGQKLRLDRMRDNVWPGGRDAARGGLQRPASEGLISAEGARGFRSGSAIRARGPCARSRTWPPARRRRAATPSRRGTSSGKRAWSRRTTSLALSVEKSPRASWSSEEAFRRYDWEFHNALSPHAGRGRCSTCTKRIYDNSMRYPCSVRFRGPTVAREHRGPFDCASVRDWRKAQSITTTHMRDCVTQMMEGGGGDADARSLRPSLPLAPAAARRRAPRRVDGGDRSRRGLLRAGAPARAAPARAACPYGESAGSSSRAPTSGGNATCAPQHGPALPRRARRTEGESSSASSASYIATMTSHRVAANEGASRARTRCRPRADTRQMRCASRVSVER